MNEEAAPLPCVYCGEPPQVVRPALPVDRMHARMVSYQCVTAWCAGQRNRAMATNGLQRWNARQRNYARLIEKKVQTPPPLFAPLGGKA